MNIKGVARLQYLYPDGRLEDVGPPVFNDIAWPVFRHFFVHSSTLSLPSKRDAASWLHASSARWRIFYGSADSKQSPLSGWYGYDGVANVSQDFPTYVNGVLPTDPDIFTLQAVIEAPVGSPRTIRCLGVNTVNNGAQSTPTDFTNSNMTLLRLTTPCTQAVNVAIVVTYIIYFYPAQSVPELRINSYLYNYIKTLFKRSADAVASSSISFGPCLLNLNTTSYKLDNLATIAMSHGGDAGSSEGEMTDRGGYASGSRTFFQNAIRLSSSFGVNDAPINGCFIKKILMVGEGINQGTHAGTYAYADPRPYGDTNPVQNVYPQRNNPPGPSQDLTVSNTATMTGNLAFNTGTWVDPGYQKLYRVNITSSGDNTTATYKLSTFNFIAGFAGNRWLPRTALLPQNDRTDAIFRKGSNSEAYESYQYIGGTTYRSKDDTRLFLAADCTRTRTGVNIYDIISGSRQSFNSVNGLNVTAVSDGETTTGYYWVTCANTGLWRISTDLTQIENIPSPTGIDKAFQICRKNDVNETLWVLFDGGLCKLSNPNASAASLTWIVHNPSTGTPTLTFTGITDSNWSNVTAMIIDPDNVVDRFLFVLGNLPGGDTSGNYRKGFVWWDTSTGVATHPGSGGVGIPGLTWNHASLLQLSDIIRCSEGNWLLTLSSPSSGSTTVCRVTYAQSNLSSVYFITFVGSRRYIPITINGIKGFMSCSTHADKRTSHFIRNTVLTTIPNNTTLSEVSVYIEFMLREGSNSYSASLETNSGTNCGMLASPVCYLPNSNFFVSLEYYADNSYGVTPFMLPPSHSKYNTYKGAFWKEYGWDGLGWVLNHAGSKTLHSANESVSVMDGLGLSFTNGATGTSFVNGEFFTFAVGDGILKDNGVNTYTCNFWVSMDATKDITLSGSVPTSALGLLTDEPVTFTPLDSNRSSTSTTGRVYCHVMQNKGDVYGASVTSGVTGQLISDQLIPANTTFEFKFKWWSVAVTGESTNPYIGLATGTGTYTRGLHFRLNRNTGALTVYNNSTLLATIAAPDIEKECKIVRDASNNVICYYDGVAQHAAVNTTSQFVIMAEDNGGAIGCGWYNCILTYTEARRVMRVGSAVGSTGSYNAKFSSLTYGSTAADTKVYIGSGTPLEAVLDYSTAGVALTGTGRVKVCAGAGWLIFHDSEPANPVSGRTVAHFVLNNQ